MDTKKTPLAVAIFILIVYLFCLLSVAILPNLSKIVFGSWFHGTDLSTTWNPTFSAGSIVIGFISAFVLSYIGAWIFVKIYKTVVK
ncbi:MAG: hypothetical protein HW405_75 [Candidatus Berkelbacteria bacterium]|nr:hypothetical protein [Candidatus Berkelbacteria bacterium]